MPYMVLTRGQAVLLDDEDYDWAMAVPWYVWEGRTRTRCIVHDDRMGGRLFRVRLHRAIALRINPDLQKRLRDVKVSAKNGDYCDVRRANLEVTIRSRTGPNVVRKPEGIALRYKRPQRATRDAILVGDLPRSPFAALWAGGVVSKRVGGADRDGVRPRVQWFAGAVIVVADGQGGGGLRGDHGGQHDPQERERQGDAPVLSGGEDQGV